MRHVIDLLLAVAAIAALAVAGEGPLNNDSFQPTNLTAEQLFASGARDLVERPGAGALESLRSALAASSVGEGVRLPAAASDEGAAARVVLGVEAAVFWALEGTSDTNLAAWTARFDELARESAATGSPPADIERRFPATDAALGAALVLADQALEAGRTAAATAYLDRAERHAKLRTRAGALTPERALALAAAIARRRAALAQAPSSTTPVASHRLPAVWDTISELPYPRTIPFEFTSPDEDPYLADLMGVAVKHALIRGPGLGLLPGLVALDPSTVAVQTAAGLHVLDVSRATRARVFEPAKLVEPAFGRIGGSRAARKGGAPGWAHLPAVAGDELLLVVGRTEPGHGPNALVAVSIDSLRTRTTSPLDLASDEPRADWILSGSRIFRDERYIDPPELAPLEGAEIQPGTLVLGDSLLFQARVLDGEVKTYLVSVELTTGSPNWVRLVAKGGDLGPVGGARFSTARLPLGSAAPLAAHSGRVLVQTNLGISALYDAVDGRLIWSFKNRRREPGQLGWSGLAPLVLDDGRFAIAPADADHAYLLEPAAPTPPARSPLTAAPLPLASSTDLVATGGSSLFTYSQTGGERQLTELRLHPSPGQPPRLNSVLLRRDESFVGLPALSKTRILASSNRGLFVFDRTRELQLIEQLPIPGGAGPREAGGSVYALAGRLLVLGPGTLWVFDPPR